MFSCNMSLEGVDGDFDQLGGTFVGADKYFEWNIYVNRNYYSVSHHA